MSCKKNNMCDFCDARCADYEEVIMDKCFICGKEIQRDSIPRIEPVVNNIMSNKDNEKHPVCDACGNLISIVFKIKEEL